MMILVGDVGGTKTILALYECKNKQWICNKKEIYVSAAVNSFTILLAGFLEGINNETIKSVCVGVAGPIVNGDCITTNLPWILKADEIAKQVGVQKISLINDLEAAAWGVMNMPEQDFEELNPTAKEKKGNVAILAAGTGLGEAIVIANEDSYQVVATEGGHTDFAPRNEAEIGLLRFLMAKHPDHVSYERVVCGQGLQNIYQYLKRENNIAVNIETERQMEHGDAAAVIGEMAVKGSDPLCVKSLEMFCAIYGAESANLTLKCLSKGGVVLAGGIAVKILPYIKNGVFMRGFLAKGRYKELLREVSVRVCLNQEAGLLGALYYADQQLKKGG